MVHEWCRPLVVGHPEILRRAVALWQTGVRVVEIDVARAGRAVARRDPLHPPAARTTCWTVPPGTLDARAGQAAYDAVVAATRLALAGRVDAITTAPLHKEALHRAGHDYPGHTELLAELCGVDDFAMMLYLGPDEDLLLAGRPGRGPRDAAHGAAERVRRVDRGGDPGQGPAGRSLHVAADAARRPRIGVCALNPHGGEGGLFGDEERTIIRPAVERGLAEGLRLEGPLPTDTLMVQARDGRFDAVVAMYHDQGHIALKLLGMHRAVNVTLGLPIIRTSVAHGTAFDIAWQRQAETGSMIEALRVASRLAMKSEPKSKR